MRVLFAGTPQFAVPSLESVSREHEVCGVLTTPDRPAGRGKGVKSSPVKDMAMGLNLHLLQPAGPDEEFIREVERLAPELLVVAAYGRIFKENFLNIFPKGGVNVHPSLLPKYRGPSPIPAAILAGETETGITIQRLALKMDAGDILAQVRYPLDGRETTGSLTPILAEKGAGLLVSVLAGIGSGKAEAVPQQEEEASYCRLVRKEDGRIDWGSSAVQIERMLRAYHPWPGVYTAFKGKTVVFHKGHVRPGDSFKEDSAPGKVLGVDKEHGILINTYNGILYVEIIQPEFRKPQSFREFLNGHQDFIGSVLGGK